MQIVKSLLNWMSKLTKPSQEVEPKPEPTSQPDSVIDKPKSEKPRKKRYYPPKQKSQSSTKSEHQSQPKSEEPKLKSAQSSTSPNSSMAKKRPTKPARTS